MDEIDSILSEVEPQQAAAPAPGQAAATAAPSVDEIDSILGGMPEMDELTGEEIPEPFSGASPRTALNKTPLTAFDRFKLSMGNEKGNIEYLSKRFDAVEPISGETGELAVKKDGKWFRVDPKSGDIRDPWELAKNYINNPGEFVGDMADLGPIGIGVGAAAAAGAALGAAPVAAATAAGLGAATLRTSLGRVIGTYDATPAEQAWDIAFETLLNAGMTKIGLGVKPTASKIAETLGPLAARFKDTVDELAPDTVKRTAAAVAESPKALFKKVFAGYSVGIDNFDTMVQNPTKVSSLMRRLDAKTGGNVSAYHDEAARFQLNEVQSIAENSRNIMSQIYGSMKNKILDGVDDSFSANFDDAINTSYREAISKGIGKIVVKSTSKAPGEKDWITGIIKEGAEIESSRSLVGKEAAEYLAKNGLKNARFQLLSQNEMSSAIKAGAELKDELGFLAADSEAYALIRSFYDDLGKFSGASKRTGRQAAQDLLSFKKIAAERAWSLANSEKAQSLPGVKRILDSSRTEIDKSIRNGLSKSGVGGLFDEMNATYSNLNKEFAPLLQAAERYKKTGDQKVYEGLLSAFLAKPGKQASKRFAVDAAIEAAEKHGLKAMSKNLANSKLKVQVGEAAKAFNPLKPSQMKADALGVSVVGMGAYAAATANPALLGAVALGQTLRSPKTAMLGVGLTQAMSKGQAFLSKQTPELLDQFFSSPQAINTFNQAIIQTPLIRNATHEQLMNQIQAVSQGGAPQ